jgi:TetR/AcrR family transcriptional repressor of nem operon
MKLMPMNKYRSLIEAAKLLFHQKGYYRTTLADIAENAGVSLGVEFHYFRTKEMLATTVIEEIGIEYGDLFSQFKTGTDPKVCLTLFIQSYIEDLGSVIGYGCKLGSLCQELAKQDGPLADQLAKLLYDSLLWCEIQFYSLGFNEKASDLALNLVSNLQGAHLLANIFKDPKLLKQQIKEIQLWLEQLILGLDDSEAVTQGRRDHSDRIIYHENL